MILKLHKTLAVFPPLNNAENTLGLQYLKEMHILFWNTYKENRTSNLLL